MSRREMWVIRWWVIILLGWGMVNGVWGQKVLQIERSGSLKTIKMHIGDEVTFSLKGAPRQYYTRDILDLFPEVQTIQFAGGAVSVDQIAAIRMRGSNHWAKSLGGMVGIFTGVWATYSLLDVLINTRAPAPFQYWVGGIALGVTGILFLVPERVLRMGDRRRLRVLDLTFYPDSGPQGDRQEP